jgi:hypothetical protein
MRFIRDPATGKRVSRANPPAAWMRTDVPHLRIVDQETWDSVQQRLGAIRSASGADNPDRPKYWEKRRPLHLLSKKVFCGSCCGFMVNVGSDYLGCNAARKQGVVSVSREPRCVF